MNSDFNYLEKPYLKNFNRLNSTLKFWVPGQWLVSKTIPVFKNKGDRKDIKNYRPISNLCSSSKIFEKLFLKRILDLQDEHDVDLTGSNKHG